VDEVGGGRQTKFFVSLIFNTSVRSQNLQTQVVVSSALV